MVKITFFGVRGSTPCANNKVTKYGGHTSCVAVETGNELIFFDAGSGIYEANSVYKDKPSSIILFSHLHIDHIQGLPFFCPLWNKNHQAKFYAGNVKNAGGLKACFSRVFGDPFFPVPFEKFPAKIDCYDINVGEDFMLFSNLKVKTRFLNHPNGAVAYRLEVDNKIICYVTDHEHRPHKVDSELANFIKDATVFIYDSSYCDHTLKNFEGWGHSTWQEALRLGSWGGVKHTVIFHHDPSSSDQEMEKIELKAKKLSPNSIVAKQNMELYL